MQPVVLWFWFSPKRAGGGGSGKNWKHWLGIYTKLELVGLIKIQITHKNMGL